MTDIGAMLREARMREHLDIAEFEARSKIRAKYLRALEDEEWSLLPGYTFTKAFLRTYADMLGLDGRMLVDEFKRQHQDPSETELAPSLPSRRDARRAHDRPRERAPDRGRERRKPPRSPSSRWLFVAILVVLIGGALAAVGLLSRNHHKSATTKSTSTRTHTTATHTQPPPVRQVALKLVATATTHVCLIGYKTAGGPGQQRLNAQLTPASREPVRHADNRFVVSFTGGAIRMIINGHGVTVAATGATVSYEILLGGRHLLLPATRAPHCK
jgi:hypothetical protein